ncbi:hypothetical protein Cflav_PD4900 [Pedosphaera parvula Ellin514]|uniref:Uncharacterized protein n=1 Tax=Pedosphaera parvula (strain Ellin514) TaxID=320771 RepID=B9XCR9_PEDPL|nr:hypothetical protein Cflav_PD4900 [Pedosphaera parvula Ellin514]
MMRCLPQVTTVGISTRGARGIPPDVQVHEPPSAYTEQDPTLEKGLAILRQQLWSNKNQVNNERICFIALRPAFDPDHMPH